jgi:hypothetical protein
VRCHYGCALLAVPLCVSVAHRIETRGPGGAEDATYSREILQCLSGGPHVAVRNDMNSIPIRSTVPEALFATGRKRLLATRDMQLMVEERFGAEAKADRQAFLHRCASQMQESETVDVADLTETLKPRECVVQVSIGAASPPLTTSRYEFTLRWRKPPNFDEGT